VLADYAAAGRTVVISSHLLAEVQATCSHVVVMDQGKVVLTGAMAALTATDHVTLIGLADGADRQAAIKALAVRGLRAVPENGQLRVSGELPRSEIVAGLVADGFGVDSVDGRRQLEEVFMTLVGTTGSDRE
jgi:ABC-2 type transport system ATP-binding protein